METSVMSEISLGKEMSLMDHNRMGPQTWQCSEQVLRSKRLYKVQGHNILNHSS